MKLLIEKVSKSKIEWSNTIKDYNRQICLLLNTKGTPTSGSLHLHFRFWWCPLPVLMIATSGSHDVHFRFSWYLLPVWTTAQCNKFFRYFKRSKDREFDDDEFIPINVHLQNFNIGKIADYKTISCGAAAAHSKGFKGSNGLWQHLEVTVDEQIPEEGKPIILSWTAHFEIQTEMPFFPFALFLVL